MKQHVRAKKAAGSVTYFTLDGFAAICNTLRRIEESAVHDEE